MTWRAALLLVLLVASVAEARPWSWLGVRIRDMSEQEMDDVASKHGIREGFGVVIVDVIDDAPAAKAGLKAGDIVVALDDRPVTDTRLLQQLIAATPAEREIRVTVLRPDGRRPLPVRLRAMPRAIAGERVAADLGFVLQESPLAPDAGTRRSGAGAPAVSVVVRGSAAERAGMEAGDVILQVGEQPVVSRDAAREALGDVDPARPLRLTVRRGERLVSLEVGATARP